LDSFLFDFKFLAGEGPAFFQGGPAVNYLIKKKTKKLPVKFQNNEN
jgi:hypothetical protein